MVSNALGDPLGLAGNAGLSIRPDALTAIGEHCHAVADQLGRRGAGRLPDLIERIDVGAESIAVTLNGDALTLLLLLGETAQIDAPPLTLTLPVRLTRTVRILKLVQRDGRTVTDETPNGSLIKLLALAHTWNERLRTGDADVSAVARDVGKTKSYVTRVVRLAYLAPDVTTAILAGRQHADLSSRLLTATDAIPRSWGEQRQLFLPGDKRAL